MKRKPLFVALSIAALSFASLVYSPAVLAQAAVVQPKEGWYKHIVDIDTVKQHADLPKDDKAALLIDSRAAERLYDNGHIPLAINIPDSQFDKLAPTKLPSDKAKPLIFYCQGYECMLSHKSAYKAEALGYTNIKVFPGGQPEWVAKGELVAVSLAYIKKLINDKADFLLVDSRPTRTVERDGTIPGSINLPDTQFDKQADKLPANKDTMLIFYCGGLKCPLSSSSALKARALGYKNVFIFPEGHPAWVEAHNPAATMGQAMQSMTGAMSGMMGTAMSTAAIVIESGKEKGSISVNSFERILKENPSQILIVDVRDEKEVKKGMFPGAINIPINELEKKLSSLPKDKPVVFTCATGARSGEAFDTAKLLASDIKAYFLDADTDCDGNMCKIKPH